MLFVMHASSKAYYQRICFLSLLTLILLIVSNSLYASEASSSVKDLDHSLQEKENKIKSLRRFSKEQLGEKFDPNSFHQMILKNANVPTALLEQRTINWLITQKAQGRVSMSFDQNALENLKLDEKAQIANAVVNVYNDVREDFQSLQNDVTVTVSMVDRDLDEFGGVTGIALSPSKIRLEIATKPLDKPISTIEEHLVSTLYHEFHHVAHGWTIEGNSYPLGIPTASVQEGLASAYAYHKTGVPELWTAYSEDVEDWLKEVLSLPFNASYSDWVMNTHPDGRKYIGYKVGRYIVERALALSGQSIIQLSQLSTYEILDLINEIDADPNSIEKLADHFADHQKIELALTNYKRAKSIQSGANRSRLDKKISLLTSPIKLQDPVLNKLAGLYKSQAFDIVLLSENDQLIAQTPDMRLLRLRPETPNTFFTYQADMTFEFIDNPASSDTQFILHAPQGKLTFTKVPEGK